MADQNTSGVGREVAPEADPGQSMRGVTGYEATVFAQSAANQQAVFAPGEAHDAQGRPFPIPVDGEHKATVLKVWTCGRPHMLSFHLNWLSFFITFIAVFAAAPLVPAIREDINMTKAEAGASGVATVTGAIGMRIIMGVVCDVVGPRYAHAVLQLLIAPAVFCFAAIQTGVGFIICRFFVGLNLATFVATQFWCSIMFTPKIVGLANATAGGWGNLGGGVTQLLMPLLFLGIQQVQVDFLAWRWSFFVPGGFMVFIGACILFFGQDLPDGQYHELKKAGVMKKVNSNMAFWCGVRNYRTWILVVNYGMCFGVELTIDNIITEYFFDHFGMSLTISGLLGAIFGLMNIFSRASGGALSDFCAKRFGMRGRLWSHWILQTLEGIFCILMGISHESMTATLIFLVIFSIFCQAACGSTYGIVPFISKRGLGIVSGLVGAGGNAGGVITQSAFFVTERFSTYEGMIWMGVLVICVTQLLLFIWFPMWGGMIFGPRQGYSEIDYYGTEFTEPEKAEGLHEPVMKFANASKGERPPALRDVEYNTAPLKSVELKTVEEGVPVVGASV